MQIYDIVTGYSNETAAVKAEGEDMDDILTYKGFLCDMDGVVYHGNMILPGVKEFVKWLYDNEKPFMFLTNSSGKSARELQQKLARMGLEVDESHFYSSAMATASFLSSQMPGCRAFVIGEPGLIGALYEAGVTIDDVDPDYVVIGETSNYNYESICKAVRLVNNGARLIGTNPDITGPVEGGIVPACGALVAPVEKATGKNAYFIGKPNSLIMRTAVKRLGVHSSEAVMIGDRMDTDVIAGIEGGLYTALVLSGVTAREDVEQYPFRPSVILNGVGDIPKLAKKK